MLVVTKLKSDVHHLLPVCRAEIEIRLKFLISECLLPRF
jgi:hypothetical protein